MRAIREQIASAVQLVVQQMRFADGSRKITAISEVSGMEGDVITMQDIFQFQQEGFDEQGGVVGRFAPTGFVPKFYDDLQRRGVPLEMEIFRIEGQLFGRLLASLMQVTQPRVQIRQGLQHENGEEAGGGKQVAERDLPRLRGTRMRQPEGSEDRSADPEEEAGPCAAASRLEEHEQQRRKDGDRACDHRCGPEERIFGLRVEQGRDPRAQQAAARRDARMSSRSFRSSMCSFVFPVKAGTRWAGTTERRVNIPHAGLVSARLLGVAARDRLRHTGRLPASLRLDGHRPGELDA